jgi:hypothetical protein
MPNAIDLPAIYKNYSLTGIFAMALSVMAVMVRAGFTPGLAEMALPSHTYRFS